MERPIVYLYNGALLEEDGQCALPIPRLFDSVEDAQRFLDGNKFDLQVVKALRKGDVLVVAPISKEDQNAIDELAMRFFEGTGDAMAVSWSIRNVILARLEWVAKRGKDTGD